MGHAVPRGASPQAALHDDWECRDRHRLDRVVLAALSLSRANLLEPHGNRVAIHHRFHCHPMSPIKTDGGYRGLPQTIWTRRPVNELIN